MLKLSTQRAITLRLTSRIPSARCFAVSARSWNRLDRPLGDRTIESNLATETNKLSKSLSKFWKNANIKYDDNNYHVQLDGKTLRTPLGFQLSLPESKQQLAKLIAHEWANLPDLKIKTNALPLTSLASRAVDLTHVNYDKNVADREELIAKVGNIEDIKVNVLRYLDTDTCLIFATHKEYSGKLRQKQDELYIPLIEEYNEFFTTYARSKSGLLPHENDEIKLQYLDCEVDGLRGNRQTITTANVVLDWLDNVPVFDLIALERAVLTTKSFLCGITLLRSNVSHEENLQSIYQVNKQNAEDYYHKTIEEIIELGNLETIFQTQEWGEVEDTHDVDKVDWLRNLTSAALVCH
ncbi:Protein ATP12 mitochondrial [Spathaspora sp. JA1]|nr:Protein ATP12 mitochondrial [Spathaspora sp. JA1]